MSEEIKQLKEHLQKEQNTRLQAEKLLERKSRELFESTTRLQQLSAGLEKLVTERTAELEKERDEALTSARSKTEFLANMSHEIRTPMNGILGMIQALKKCHDPKKRNKLLGTAEESGKLLVAIIEDIQESSKIDNRGLVLDEEAFDLRDTVESMMQDFAKTANAKQLEFITDISARIPKKITADPARIKQVIGNLVNNAIKFTERGEVVFSLGYLGDNEFRFAVQDTGIGMSRDECERIFSAFTQTETSSTKKYGGAGLSLSISSKIVEAYKSKICVTSKLGEGTRFYFYLTLPVVDTESIASDFLQKELKPNLILVSNSEARSASFEVLFSDLGAEKYCVVKNLSALMDEGFSDSPNCTIFIDEDVLGEEENEQLLRLREQFPAAKIIELTSCLRERDNTGLFDFKLIKPIHLMDVINVVSGNYDDLPSCQVDHGELEYDFAGKHLLVVDDNIINLEVAQEIFEDVGFEVTLAMSGREAIGLAKNDLFDMVLMDIQMPSMDGFEATQKIRELNAACKALPIIALTAHAMREDREKSLAAGLNEHVTKPIDLDVILPVLARFLGVTPGYSNASSNIPEEVPSSSVQSSSEAATEEKDILRQGEALLQEQTIAAVKAGVENPYADLAALNIPQLKGFDLPGALKRLRGRWRILKPYIISFAEEHQQADKILEGFLCADKFDDAMRMAHKIKGSGANIGAIEISSTAAKIEALLKSGEQIISPALLEKFSSDVKVLYGAVAVLTEDDTVEEETDSAEVEVSGADVASLLKKIENNMSSDLGSVSENIEHLRELTSGSRYSALAKNINEAFNKFQLAEIHEIIDGFSHD